MKSNLVIFSYSTLNPLVIQRIPACFATAYGFSQHF